MAGSLIAPATGRGQGRWSGAALVIGNSRYSGLPYLPNAERDARDVAARFEALGIRTVLVSNAGQRGLRTAFNQLASAARGADFAAVYFVGHGLWWDKDTYFVPTDIPAGNLSGPQDLVLVNAAAEATQQAAHRIFVFDICRESPLTGWRWLDAERAAVVDANRQDTVGQVFPDVLTLYSTAPGHNAIDGPRGQNSPFCAAFLRYLEGGVDIKKLPERLRRDLLIATRGKQILFGLNSYRDAFQLGVPDTNVEQPAPTHNGWQLVELDKAYEYARKNNIPLPPGLVAIRPAQGSAYGDKVGSFQFEAKGGGSAYPEILVILSVDEEGVANIVMSGAPVTARYWRFLTGQISGNRLNLQPHGTSAAYQFDWRDANSGSLGLSWSEINVVQHNARFKRMDG